MVELVSFVQSPYLASEQWHAVETVAKNLLEQLNAAQTLVKIAEANRPGASSAEVQATLRASRGVAGFPDRAEGSLAGSILRAASGRFLSSIGDTGILLEVERGKTTTNNMDLLDFWKCHISKHAAYLFLLVPKALQHNAAMTLKREFASVQRRLPSSSNRTYTNVGRVVPVRLDGRRRPNHRRAPGRAFACHGLAPDPRAALTHAPRGRRSAPVSEHRPCVTYEYVCTACTNEWEFENFRSGTPPSPSAPPATSRRDAARSPAAPASS